MRAGTLDRRITIQRKGSTQSPSGEPTDGWSTIALRLPASMWPVKGDERVGDPAEVASEQIEFKVRYSQAMSSLSPKDRIIHPALTAEQAEDGSYVIPPRSIHDVLAVLEIGRREGFKIITSRRADVS